MRSLPLVLSLVPIGASQEGGAVDAADFRAWVEGHAIELDSLDPKQLDPARFAFLDEVLGGTRIVYLGETDHFIAERMEFRLILIRELAKRGFRRIGMEMGRSDARRMDRYLETGDETWLGRVALYGYRGDLREDRVDEVAGWTDDAHTEFTQTVIDEGTWLLRQLRAINEELPEEEPRLSWFGYDLSFRPGGGYADARELLAPHEGGELVGQVLERMERVAGESRIEEAERLESLVGLLDEHRDELLALLGERGALDLRRALQRMADAFRLIEGLQGLGDFDPSRARAALAARELRMEHNFDEHLAEWPEDEKLILLGHALHLSKASESIDTGTYGSMWRSIGTYLARKLPGEVYAVWLLHHRGEHGIPRAVPPVRRFRSSRDAVERIFARVHPILVLPLGSDDPREAWLDEERVFTTSGAPGRTVLSRQVDCLFFVEEAHEPGYRHAASGDEPR